MKHDLKVLGAFIGVMAICVVVKLLIPSSDLVSLLSGAALMIALHAYFKREGVV